MAGATATKIIGMDGISTDADRAELATQLGLSVDQCYFDVNTFNPWFAGPVLSARQLTEADPVQDFSQPPT
jgi:hypothetical protein